MRRIEKLLITLTLCTVFVAGGPNSWARSEIDSEEAVSDAAIEIELVPESAVEANDNLRYVCLREAKVPLSVAEKWNRKDLGGIGGDAEVEMQYPKIAFHSKQLNPDSVNPSIVEFRDDKSQLKRRIEIDPIKKVAKVSPQGSHVLITKSESDENGEFEPGAELYNEEGELLWKTKEGMYAAVADNGYVVKGGAGFFHNEKMEIIDPCGKKVADIPTPDSHIAEGKFSDDGELFISLFSSGSPGASGIQVVRKTGEVVLPATPVSGRTYLQYIHLSEKGIAFPAWSFGDLNSEIVFLGWDGKERWRRALGVLDVRVIGFSPEEDFLYAVSNQSYVWCLYAKTGEIVWQHNEPWAIPEHALYLEHLKNKTSREDFYAKADPFRTGNVIFFRGIITKNYLLVEGWTVKDGKWKDTGLEVLDIKTGEVIKKLVFDNKRLMFQQHGEKLFSVDTTKGEISRVNIRGSK